MASATQSFDAVVIGAGFSGMYMLKSLRDKLGLKVRVYEAGETVGGTWYWNRYPGARCDSDSYIYCFTWDKQLLQEWEWSERYPEQPEILRYLEHVAKRHDLKRDMQFNTRVTGARIRRKRPTCGRCAPTRAKRSRHVTSSRPWAACRTRTCPSSRAWRNSRANGTTPAASPTLALTSPPSAWAWSAPAPPRCRPFPRSPSRPSSSPCSSAPPTTACRRATARWTPKWSRRARPTMTASSSASANPSSARSTTSFRSRCWKPRPRSGSGSSTGCGTPAASPSGWPTTRTCSSIKEANDLCADYIKRKIRKTVKDPAVAEKLIPKGHAYGTKRQPLDTNYYETFNKDNVLLVDATTDGGIEEITEKGIRAGGKEYEFDIIVFATGFDAMTGPLKALNLKGRGGRTLDRAVGGRPAHLPGHLGRRLPQLVHHHRPAKPIGAVEYAGIDRAACGVDHRLHRQHAQDRQDHDRGDAPGAGSVGVRMSTRSSTRR